MELADMPVLETGAVKSVGVRIPRGPPSLEVAEPLSHLSYRQKV